MLFHISLITSALTALALASPHPGPAQLAQRDFASCQQDGLVACCLYASPSLASPYCASVLQTSTVTAPAVTLSTNVTSTVVVTVNATHIVPTTTTSTSVITRIGTLTITESATKTTTETTTTTAALATAPPAKKARRDAAPSPPPCVTQGTSYPASRITFACSCLYTQPTITVTPSASTATITFLTTTSPVVTVTVYSTTTIPLTITTTSSTTTSTTTTTTTTAVSTSIAPAGYTLAIGPVTGQVADYNIGEFMVYLYTGDLGVNNVNAVDHCRDSCTINPNCQFFFLTFSSIFSLYPLCELSEAPYSPQDLTQYGVPEDGAYYVGYNKVLS